MPNLYTGEFRAYKAKTHPREYNSPHLKPTVLVAVFFNNFCMGNEINYDTPEGKAVQRATNAVWNKHMKQIKQEKKTGRLPYLEIVPIHNKAYWAVQYKLAGKESKRKIRISTGDSKVTKKIKMHKGIRGVLQRYRKRMMLKRKAYFAKQRAKADAQDERKGIRKFFGNKKKPGRGFFSGKRGGWFTGYHKIRKRLGIGKRGKPGFKLSLSDKVAPVDRSMMAKRMTPRQKHKIDKWQVGQEIGRKMRVNPGRLRKVAARGLRLRGVMGNLRSYKNIADQNKPMITFGWGITNSMFGNVEGGAGFYNYAGVVNDLQRGAGRGGGRKPYARDVKKEIVNMITRRVQVMNEEIMRRPQVRDYLTLYPLMVDVLHETGGNKLAAIA